MKQKRKLSTIEHIVEGNITCFVRLEGSFSLEQLRSALEESRRSVRSIETADRSQRRLIVTRRLTLLDNVLSQRAAVKAAHDKWFPHAVVKLLQPQASDAQRHAHPQGAIRISRNRTDTNACVRSKRRRCIDR